MLEFIQTVDDAVKYLVLFLFAAAPWLEIFLVVPLGIAIGLSPTLVAFTAFLGNFLPIVFIIFLYEKWLAWRQKRKGTAEQKKSKYTRAKQIWDKYGVIGLAIVAPAIIGTHLAALLALAFGSSRSWVLMWMTISLALWTIGLTIASVFGLAFLDRL